MFVGINYYEKSSGAFHIVWKAVFVNKKVKQKGSKKVSTLSTYKL